MVVTERRPGRLSASGHDIPRLLHDGIGSAVPVMPACGSDRVKQGVTKSDDATPVSCRSKTLHSPQREPRLD